METYRLSWVPSESTFVQDQQIWASVNGGVLTQLGTNQASNVSFIDYPFPTDASVDWFVKTIGDNDSVADSAHDTFTAQNFEKVQPATGLAHMFVSHSE